MFSSASGKDSLLDLFNTAVQARKTPTLTSKSSPSPSNDLLKNLLGPEREVSPIGNSNVIEVKRTIESTSKLSSPAAASATAAQESSNEPQILVQFKKAAPSEPLLAVSGSLFVYGVSERRLRVVDWMRGWKCVIDRNQGAFVDVAFSLGGADASIIEDEEATLAVLAEDGEIILGRVTADEDAGELSFEPQASLSFPEIGRAAGLSWSLNSKIFKNHLAVYGKASSEVFFVHVQGGGPFITTKTSFISTRIESIQGVTCIGNFCFVAGSSGVEVFKWSVPSSSFEAAEFVQFSVEVEGTIFVFECPNQGIVISRVEDCAIVKFFSYREGEAQEISQLSLPAGVVVDRVVFDARSQCLLCYSRGETDIHAIRIGKLASPQLITSAFSASTGVLKLAISEAVVEDEEEEEAVGVFAYLNDCIIQHSVPLHQSELVDTEMDTETEVEDYLSDSVDVSSPKLDSIASSTTSQPINVIDPEAIKSLVKEAVLECVHDSLAGIIHEALNSSVQAGFDQIARDLSALIGELVRNVNISTQPGTAGILSVPAHLPPSPSIQDIRELIAEGKAGEALIKAASVKDSRLLLEACRQLDDPFAALDKDPLSQATLVSLFKLLSADIDEDTELKLDWLQEVLIQIDLEEAIGESPTMLKDIGTLLSDLKELVGDSLVDAKLEKKMKTVMRLLRKFQMN